MPQGENEFCARLTARLHQPHVSPTHGNHYPYTPIQQDVTLEFGNKPLKGFKTSIPVSTSSFASFQRMLAQIEEDRKKAQG